MISKCQNQTIINLMNVEVKILYTEEVLYNITNR